MNQENNPAPEPFDITHVRFLKGRAHTNGTKAMFYPVNCVAKISVSGMPDLLRKNAVDLVNKGVCVPHTPEGIHETTVE